MSASKSCKGVLAKSEVRQELGNAYSLIEEKLLKAQFSHGDNFEKLHGNKQALYSMRLNEKKRILLTHQRLEGESYWLLLDYLSNHEYERSAFSNSQYLSNFLARNNKVADFVPNNAPAAAAGAGAGAAAAAGVRIEPQELRLFNNQLLVFRTAQENALGLNEPLLVTGMPGSGKSSVALAYLTQHLEAMPEEALPLLYVTESQLLTNTMHRIFQETPWGQMPSANRVQFLSYQQLIDQFPATHGLASVGKDAFFAWFKASKNEQVALLKKELGKEAAALIYQELRMMSAMVSLEQYEALGERESPLYNNKTSPLAAAGAIEGNKRRAAVFAIRRPYQQYLESNKQYDPAFLIIPTAKAQYSHIVVDEAQDFSTLQLLILSHLTEKTPQGRPAIAYYADSNQSIADNFPKINFFKTFLQVQHFQELPGTFRCSQAVLKVANQVLGMKYHLLGGLLDKGMTPFIIPSKETPLGAAYLIPENGKTPGDVAGHQHLDALAQTVHCVIITPEEEMEAARKRFPKAIILSPKEAKGLEYPKAILYRMFNRPYYQDINPLLENYQPLDSSATVHRPKAGTADYSCNALLNEIFIGLTRAREQVFIVQDTEKHALRYISHLLRQVMQAPDKLIPSTVAPSSIDDWKNEVERQLEQGNNIVAQNIIVQHLGMAPADFEEKYPRFSQDDKKQTIAVNHNNNDKNKSKPKEKNMESSALVNSPRTKRSTENVKSLKTSSKISEAVKIIGPTWIPGQAKKHFSIPQTMQTLLNDLLCSPANSQKFEKALKTLIDNEDAVTILFQTQIQHKNQRGILFSFINQCKNKMNSFCLLLKDNKKFAKRFTLKLLCSPIEWAHPTKPSLLYLLAMEEPGLDILNNLLEINPDWVQSDLFSNTLTQILPGPPIEGHSALYQLCTSVKGRDLLWQMVEENPKLLSHGFMKALFQPCKGKFFNSSLAGLCGYITDNFLLTKIITRIIEMPGEIIKGFINALCRQEDTYIAPLCVLCLHPKGHELISLIIKNDIHLSNFPLFSEKLLSIFPKGEYKDHSGLLFLCATSEGKRILDKLTQKNPELFEREDFIKALCYLRPFCADSALFQLCTKPEGRSVFNKIIDINQPLLENDRFILALTLSQSDSKEKLLSLLKESEDGLALLKKMKELSPKLRKKLDSNVNGPTQQTAGLNKEVAANFFKVPEGKAKATQSEKDEKKEAALVLRDKTTVATTLDTQTLVFKMLTTDPNAPQFLQLLENFLDIPDFCNLLLNMRPLDGGEPLFYNLSMDEKRFTRFLSLLDKPEIAKKFTLESLCKPHIITGISVLIELTLQMHGAALLAKLIQINPQWVKNKTFHEALFTISPRLSIINHKHPVTGVSALSLLCTTFKNQELLLQLVKDNPDLISKEFMLALCNPTTGTQTSSGLAALSLSEVGLSILTYIFNTKSEIKLDSLVSALCLPVKKDVSSDVNSVLSNASALSNLFDCDKGQHVILQIITNNLQLLKTSLFINKLWSKDIGLSSSCLYLLSCTPTGHKILDLLITNAPELFERQDFVFSLFAESPKEDNTNASGLFFLCAIHTGHSILDRIIDINKSIINEDRFIELFLKPTTFYQQSDQKTCRSFYWLQTEPKGVKLLLKMRLCSPKLQAAMHKYEIQDAHPQGNGFFAASAPGMPINGQEPQQGAALAPPAQPDPEEKRAPSTGV